MKTAVVVVDMVKDNMELSPHEHLAQRGRAIAPGVNRLTRAPAKRAGP